MSKPYTEGDFSDQVTRDRTWRIREISDLKNSIYRGDEGVRRVLLRALIALAYAHWEGHVRFAAVKFLEFVALRNLPFSSLDRQFFRNYFLPRLADLSAARRSISERCNLIDEILDSSGNRFKKAPEKLINTQSNLNFEVFTDICRICGVPTAAVQSKATFIDVFLLKRRNAVAHGEDTLVAMEDLDQLIDETIGLMRFFGDALENIVSLKTYRAFVVAQGAQAAP